MSSDVLECENIMNKFIVIVLCSILYNVSNLLSQDLRDNFIGQYQCKVSSCSWNQFGQYECRDYPGTTLVFEKRTDSLQIVVIFENNSRTVLTKVDDSTYTYPQVPYTSARFHSKDSVKLSVVHGLTGYSVYKGKKIINSVNIVPYGLNCTPYPNPFVSHIFIEPANKDKCNFQIFDLNGRQINVRQISNGNIIIIDTGKTSSGTYFLKIWGSDYLYSCKMIKLQ